MDEFAVFTDLELLARAIWGEARGEPIEAQVGVGCVIRNRVKHPRWHWGRTFREVILKPWQFSAFNRDDPNRAKMLQIPDRDVTGIFQQCLWVAQGILSGGLFDSTAGANHYYTQGTQEPSWAKGISPAREYGKLLFYRL